MQGHGYYAKAFCFYRTSKCQSPVASSSSASSFLFTSSSEAAGNFSSLPDRCTVRWSPTRACKCPGISTCMSPHRREFHNGEACCCTEVAKRPSFDLSQQSKQCDCLKIWFDLSKNVKAFSILGTPSSANLRHWLICTDVFMLVIGDTKLLSWHACQRGISTMHEKKPTLFNEDSSLTLG